MRAYTITYRRSDMPGKCKTVKWAHGEKDALAYAFGKAPRPGADQVVGKHGVVFSDIGIARNVERRHRTND